MIVELVLLNKSGFIVCHSLLLWLKSIGAICKWSLFFYKKVDRILLLKREKYAIMSTGH